MLRKPLHAALLASLFVVAACEDGNPNEPIVIEKPTQPGGHDTSSVGVPLPNPPTKTCPPATTGEPCVNGAPFTQSGAHDISPSISGNIFDMAAVDNTLYLNFGNNVLPLNRSKDAATTAVTYAEGSLIPLTGLNRPIAVCSGKIYSSRAGALIDEIDINSKQVTRVINSSQPFTTSEITELACNSNGNTLLVGTADRSVFAYNLVSNTSTRFSDSTSTSGNMTLADFCSDGSKFIAAGVSNAGGPGGTTVYPVTIVAISGSSNTMYYPQFAARKPVASVACGKWPASAAGDSTVRIYDPALLTNDQFVEKCIKLADGNPTQVASWAGHDVVAVGSLNKDSTSNVMVWHVGTPTCDLLWHSEAAVTNGPITGLRFTPDGQLEIAGARRVVSFVMNKTAGGDLIPESNSMTKKWAMIEEGFDQRPEVQMELRAQKARF